MKFDCGLTWEEKQEWHDYFAWLPKRVGSRDCRWLEIIQRKITFVRSWDFGYWKCEYRVKETE